MVREFRGEHESEWATMGRVAELLGVSTTESVRTWVRRAEADEVTQSDAETSDTVELARLRRQVAELQRANGILSAALAFFQAELDRPNG